MATIGITPRATFPLARTAARVSIAAVVTYQVLLAVVIFIRPEIDPARHPISEYAIGRLGWIMVLAFLCSALSYASLVVALSSQPLGRVGSIGRGLLLVCTLGTVGVGVFVADPIATPMERLSTIGTLHVITGSSALVLLPVAALLINLGLVRQTQTVGALRRVLQWTAGLPLLGMLVAVVLSTIIPAEGFPPRLLLLTYMVWLITLARQIVPREENQE
jgi:hypothetical membrane protein